MPTALYEIMNITQVYLTVVDKNDRPRDFISEYQNQTTYLQLFFEECLRKHKNDVGAFNRLVFEEGGCSSEDFQVVGNNALPVSIGYTYEELSSLDSNRSIHEYFVRKFLEGFKRFDDHFSTSYVDLLEPLIKEKYQDELYFEKKMATKRIGNLRLQAVGRFSSNSFDLIIKVFDGRSLIKSKVIYQCEPDMFIVRFHAYKVDITEELVSIISKVDEKTLELNIADII